VPKEGGERLCLRRLAACGRGVARCPLLADTVEKLLVVSISSIPLEISVRDTNARRDIVMPF